MLNILRLLKILDFRISPTIQLKDKVKFVPYNLFIIYWKAIYGNT